MEDVTLLLQQAAGGDPAAQNALAPLVYGELKGRAEALMRRELRADSVQATVLVNDAFMRLIDADQVDWESRAHFFSLASNTMRRLLVDRARARRRAKRGGGEVLVALDDALVVSPEQDGDILAVNAALERLETVDPLHARIVTLKFFGGLNMQDVADAVGMSKRACEREWTLIRAWHRRELA